MNRLILFLLGLLAVAGCTGLPGETPLVGAPKPAPTYSQVVQVWEKLKDSDVVAKDERRKADENKLPDDSTAFNLRPIGGDSPLSKAEKKCKQLLSDYNKAAKQYNAAARPRKSAPEGDPDFVTVVLWGNTHNARAGGLPFTCGEEDKSRSNSTSRTRPVA